MNDALSYFLIASLYLLLFYSCYWLLLRQNTFFVLNRAYLLLSVVLSLLLPMVELPGSATESLPVGTLTLPTFAVGNPGDTTDDWTTGHWLWLVYGLGAGVMLIRFGLNLRAVFQLIRRGNIERHPDYLLVELPNDAAPSFSFGRFLVLNQTDALTRPDALLRHEEAHIRQQHTTDVLFIELMRVAFWFHPVLYLYKRALQEVHEFLADKAVLHTPQPDYARQLVAYALNVPSTALTTPFASMSTLKQRIIMLQKPKSNRRALLGYALALPVAALLVMCTQPENDVTQTERPVIVNQPARQAGVDGEIFTVVENQPEFKGGMKGLTEFLGQNLKYPAAAQKANVQGRVFVNFIVTKEGDVTDVKILKGMGFGTDAEAIRVMKLMPRWKPGTQNGRPVNVRYNLPINFQLDDKTDNLTEATPGNGKQLPFLTVPTNDADIQQQYKHFIVNDKEVSFEEFKKYPKDAIFEVSSSEHTIRIQVLPPPPSVPANNAKTMIEHFKIDGKKVSEKEFSTFPAEKIARLEVSTDEGKKMMAILTR